MFVQDFLSDILYGSTGKDEEEVLDRITEFRQKFKQMTGWEIGSQKEQTI